MKNKRWILFLIPSLAGFLTFYVVPFFHSFYYAFVENAFSQKFVWFDNFIQIIQNPSFQNAVINTLKFMAAAVASVMVLSYVIAQLIVYFGLKLPVVKKAYFLPFVLPSAIMVVFWQTYFTEFAPFDSLLVCFLWKYSGINIMLFMTALCRLPAEYYESAQIDGAGKFKQSLHVSLPLIIPTIFFTGILSVINSLKIFKESYLLYGQYPDTSVYMLQNYLNNHFTKLNYQNISTAAILFFAVIYILVMFVFNWEKKVNEGMY
ncbi:sugar ABC transporter permease [Clostridia bacterium]|nr:sugar ABC transporter permease [Clostridia bacterium]